MSKKERVDWVGYLLRVPLVLFSLAILGAFFGIVAVEGVLVNKIPMFVMLFIYSIAVYHFGFSKDYKAFFEYQNREN